MATRAASPLTASNQDLGPAMNARSVMPPSDLLASSVEALSEWPRRAAMALVEELASICESLKPALRSADAPDESLREAGDDAPRTMTLHFVYGIAMLELGERERPELLPGAVDSLGRALSLARRHTPEGVVPIKMQLYRAEHALVERGAIHA